ncbi:MAG TPA: LUD domain-containing protein [Candidatus Limnocylindrales bacterium]|nr:LUD domain-containing protein [Candidatus Limnocylindrales bacterium]
MAQTENPARDRILEKIRAALREPAPRHPSIEGRRIFALVEDPLDRFQKECAANITECTVTPDLQASARFIADALAQLPPGEIFIQDSSMLRRMSSAWQDGRAIRWSSEGAPHEASQATITHAEALVALTGSVLVSSSCGGRGATVVAPVHIVVATLDQLVPDLEAAFARIREREIHLRNSYVCLITGSSRTADIEKILVMGAHGPVRLLVVLSRSSAS